LRGGPGKREMTSKSKAVVRRRNGRRSSGPRSVWGKARSAQNARRHGLAGANPLAGASREIEALARKLVVDNHELEDLVHAREAAEIQVLLGRIHEARVNLINNCLKKRGSVAPEHQNSEHEQAIAEGARQQERGGHGVDHFVEAEAIIEVLPELMALERYEAHALARRSRVLLLFNR
jgi:hypothetical protein